jgi:hypothetical protein
MYEEADMEKMMGFKFSNSCVIPMVSCLLLGKAKLFVETAVDRRKVNTILFNIESSGSG